MQRPKLQDLSTEILTMLAHGLKQKEIADQLDYDITAVNAEIYRIFRRMGALNAANAVALALERKLITLSGDPLNLQ